MKIRYCQQNNFMNSPCSVGWGQSGGVYSKSCLDEPKEQNCRYLVEENEEKEKGEHMLTFNSLRVADIERQQTVGPFNRVAKYQSLLYWSTAIAGEVGELCNLIKKQVQDDKSLSTEIGKEIADVVIYADLLATRMGFRLEDLVRSKFNEVSERMNSKIRL